MTVNGLEREWTTHCRCDNMMVSVEPEMVNEPYAVHLTISEGKAKGPGYTITHRPSGYALWHVREFDAAVRIVHWLAENLQLPDTAEGAKNWKHTLPATERMRIADALTGIAPREWLIG